MNKKSSIQKISKPNKDLANQLKSRLYDKGFSYGTLPSVKRQVRNMFETPSNNPQNNAVLAVALGRNVINPQAKIIKQQSTVFRRPSLGETHKNKFQKIQEVIKEQQRRIQPMGINRVPSAQRLSRAGSRTQLRNSKSAYRIMSNTTQLFNRQQSAQTFFVQPSQSLQRARTAKPTNELQMRRTKLLMDKISGKHNIEALQKQNRPQSNHIHEGFSEKFIKFSSVQEQESLPFRPIKAVDRYIQLVLKNVAHVDEFIYLKKSKNYEQDPYDLQVVDYTNLKKQQKNGLKQYFTLSKKGLCLYYENNPKDFQSLTNWLEQRNTFDRIKSLNFFRQFRKWKTLKMWNKTILKQKIAIYTQALKQKLFFLNDNLRKVLLTVRENSLQLQDLKIITFKSDDTLENDTTYTLDKFAKIQKKNRTKIKQTISRCSSICRSEVQNGFEKSIKQLRQQYKPNYSKKQEQNKKKIPKNYTPSAKQLAYEKLQFPENMDYEMRSKLRSQCMRFLRFSYLIDFITMDSLKEIYLCSIINLKELLLLKESSEQVYIVKQPSKQKQMKSTVQPIFNVEMICNFQEAPPTHRQQVEPYLPPPTGSSTIADFKILSHVNLKVPKEKKQTKTDEYFQTQFEEVTKFQIELPDDLAPQWLNLSPSSEKHHTQVISSIQQGLEALRCFQRWSKHPDMKIYMDTLEQWDDKISTESLNGQYYLCPQEWIDPNYNQSIKKQIKIIIDRNFQNIHDYVYEMYEKHLLMFWQDQKIDFTLFTNQFLSDHHQSIQNSMQHLIYQKQTFSKQLPVVFDKQTLRVRCVSVRQRLQPMADQCLHRLFHMMPPYITKMAVETTDYIENSIRLLKSATTNVAEYVKQLENLKRIDKKIPKTKNKVSLIGEIIKILENVQKNITNLNKQEAKGWKNYHINLLQLMISLQNVIIQTGDAAQRNKQRFLQQMSKNIIPNLNKQISRMEGLVQQKKFLTQIPMDIAIQQLEQYDIAVKKLEQDSKTYTEYGVILSMPDQTRFENLYDLRGSLNNRLDMWRGLRDWEKMSDQWMKMVFDDIDVDQIKNVIDKYTKIVSKCSKKLPSNPILEKLKKLLKIFKDSMPVVIALSNKIVQQDAQYWAQIQRVVGFEFVINKQFTLQSLIQKNLHVFQNEIIQISTQAKQQQVLKVQIQENKARWLGLLFTTKQYKAQDPKKKDVYVLDKIDDLYAELDELLANFSSILGNRYLKRQRQQAQQIQKTLYNAMLIIDDWLVVQKNWIYLENIFSSSDIKAKLRQQNIKFENVDKNFKAHMKNTSRTKLVHKNLGHHDNWIRYKDTLAEIQKQLEKYLEDKRNDFPRFYFLSNDQLIEILAKANQVESIQRNIKKCFECVGKLIFPTQDSRYIESIASLEGQIVKLNRTNIAAKGQIQSWLKQLQISLEQTLKKYIAKGFQDYDQSKDRITFLQNHHCQVCLVVSQVNWTMDTQLLFDKLDQYYDQLLKQLSQLTTKIGQATLPPLQRKTLIALITQDVHNRDIIESLLQYQGVSKSDFVWSQQLKMYSEGQTFDTYIVAKQVNAEIHYGYQYLGVMSRLVITPLTDRCWMTIIGAINIKLGAAPAGPAGTGKTQSTKDLAKGLGMLCVVFNCSQQIDYKMMGRLFSGLSQQGAWSCLDQFNRIDIQVLSVIAQQLLTIRVAKLKGQTTFHFIDRKINLKPNCGVFITMNPGYAGRTELPDNLKVLFRSVSMMIPDYRLIAEIMLFAEGFEDAKALSRKMVQLYKLSSQQLSQQDHYDFGMRAVKSVLVMAGALKRADKQASEEEVLIRAMRNSNIPKFLREDLPLFEALISDLFPHAQIKQPNYIQFQGQINQICQRKSLQIVPNLTTKAIQLFQTFNVRFGVMIVGQTASGKTTCYDILSEAMSQFRKKGHANQSYKIVKKHVLNPKAISMGQLYGEVNQMTQQWSDGLASSIMRQCTNQENADANNWVVFDGPVDALWIQNMNTVLDDNMMLCLANGERIKLTPSMRMLFEVMDLKVASPATVSRCGMVYMISQQLGWKPFINSWLDKWCKKMVQLDNDKPQFWNQDMRKHILTLFNKSIDPMHKFVSKKAPEPISTVPLQLATSLTNLFDIYTTAEYGFKKGQDRQYKKKYITYAFVYAFIWSMCVTSFDKYHEELSFQCRGIHQQIIYANNDLVQNFYFDPIDIGFKHWNQKLTEFVYQKDQGFHEIIVDTIDTIRYASIIDQLAKAIKPVLITGMSGTGKSIQLSQISKSPLVLTSTTSHYQLQISIQSKLQKIRKNILGASHGNFTILAIDDTNMPAQQKYGSIPPIEVLRTLIDKGGVWDRKQRFWKFIQNTSFVCACSPPGGGRNYLTPRFTRHFNIMCLPQPTHTSLTRIYKQIIDGFFNANNFFDAVKKSTQLLVNGTIQIYSIIKKQKLPIPSKFHYTFNLRDVSKVCQGILEAKNNIIRDGQALGKLWLHEVSRVFKDRLNTQQDHDWFHEKIHDILQVNFRVRKRDSKIYFSNIMKLDTKQYEEIENINKVIPILEEFQDDHNLESDSKLQLVFFIQAVENVLRIQRMLSLSRGNGLLIGVSGSGKQSLTRLASYINGYKVKQIQITKGYNLTSFRDFLKELMKKCSNNNQSTTFLFTDNQIIDQLFLEDINNILNSGQIPNLWQMQEKGEIVDDTRAYNAALKRPEAPQTIYRTFVERVRQRLHVVLSMSPIGDALRIRCRKFPALVNCCTINWFFPWPQEALMSVASAILQNYERFPTYANIPKRQDVIEAFSDICKQVHNSANLEANKFETMMKRKVYTTPKSYLDMLKLYLNLLDKKQNEIFQKRDRLAGGLDKLEKASKQVAQLEITLKKLQPQLQKQSQLLNKALVQVEKDSLKAAEIQMVVSAEAQDVARQKNQVQTLADQAREKLKQVEPDLQRAKRAVQTIDRKALEVIRGYPKPPAAAQVVMQGVCILFGIKGDWDVQKKLLIKLDDFITSLKQYKKDNIPQDRLIKLRNHLKKQQFRQQVLVKKVRQMLEIAQWCKAIQKYATVFKEIEPKRKKMAQLQGELDKANRDLEQKMKSLNDAKDQVNQLKQETEKMVRRKQQLQKQLQLTKDRLVRAADLITLTKDQAVRWKQTVENIKDFIVNVPLDVFISTASISYNGPFTGSFRKNLVDYWITIVNAKELPMSEDYQITKTLGDPLILRDWMINGLPSDSVSLQNAIFVMQGHRWPLVIDPQYQAFKWLNNNLSQQKKCILKLTDKNFQSQMKASIKNGVPVLLVDVEDTLPAVLDSVFSKQVKTIDNMPMIKFGDENIYYDSRFKIYIFTKIANPNFLPEIFIRVNIINFTVTFDGLKEQLLAMVVKHERQQVQIQKDENVVKMGEYNKKINQSQLNILRLLQKAKAQTILDDIQLIQTLKVSQQAAEEIKVKIQESNEIEKNTTRIRQEYKPVAIRGSVLFFVIKDLSLIDSMYQYSLQYIEKLFKISMETAERNDDLTARLNSLIDRITKDIYKNIARGLFVKDKILFSFMIATAINREAKVIPDDLWNTFVRGPTFSDKVKKIPNPSKGLFSQRGWQLAQYLQNSFAKFTNLINSFTSKAKIWETFVQQNQLSNFPDGWEKKLDLFQKILVYRSLKPQRVVQSMTFYINNTIGPFYLQTPNVSMKDIWSDSDNKTPIIFVLSPGADSTSALLKFSNQMQIELEIISLGQGQGIFAENLIKLGKQSGKWVLLQNCHLARTWMPELQQIIEQNRSPSQQIHKQFRLFLTSMPASYFPASILQNGIKLTTQPPRGIRANVKRSWNQIDQQQLSACTGHQQTYHKMLWGLTFFHAVIQQRQKFGPLGWNIKYQFNDSDLQTSKTVLTMLLNRPDNNIPFEALLFVTGQINYGGRVTDDWDRRCLMTILQKFYSQEVLTNKYCFSKSKDYYIPQYQSLQNYKSHADSLPMQDSTLVFGMHQNANVTFLLQQQSKIMASLEIMQPKDVIAGGKSSQDLVLQIVTLILQNKQVPQVMDKNQANKQLIVTNEKGLLPSLSIVLFQEIARFNQLLKVIKRSLEDLKKAIDGLILMSDQLDEMFYDLLANRVPNNWKKVAYPSLKPMNSWMKDLKQRVLFLNNWLKEGIPTNYWLSSFFFPQGFLTAVLQQHARQPQKQIPIDELIFTFRYTQFTKQSCNIKAPEGIYVSGLILQGASWDLKRKIMCDPIKGQMYSFMPIIQFIPTRIDQKKPNEKFQTYECPVYKTSVRAGVLSTTGQSTNFVLPVQMPSMQVSDYWVLQGTALLLQLNE